MIFSAVVVEKTTFCVLVAQGNPISTLNAGPPVIISDIVKVQSHALTLS